MHGTARVSADQVRSFAAASWAQPIVGRLALSSGAACPGTKQLSTGSSGWGSSHLGFCTRIVSRPQTADRTIQPNHRIDVGQRPSVTILHETRCPSLDRPYRRSSDTPRREARWRASTQMSTQICPAATGTTTASTSVGRLSNFCTGLRHNG